MSASSIDYPVHHFLFQSNACIGGHSVLEWIFNSAINSSINKSSLSPNQSLEPPRRRRPRMLRSFPCSDKPTTYSTPCYSSSSSSSFYSCSFYHFPCTDCPPSVIDGSIISSVHCNAKPTLLYPYCFQFPFSRFPMEYAQSSAVCCGRQLGCLTHSQIAVHSI